MANEKKVTKTQICVLMEWEDFLKLKRVYGKDGESRSELLQKVLHNMVKDEKLTKSEVLKLEKIYKEQYERRMERRKILN